MVGRLGRQVGVLFYLPGGFFHNSSSKQAARGQPIGCLNVFYKTSWIPKGYPVFLQDTTKHKMMDFEGDEMLREDGWWIKLAKWVPRTPTNLKTTVRKWLDLLNKLGEVLLWNDEIGEGFSGRKWWPWMDIFGMRLLIIKSLSTSETLALHQPLIFIQKSCKQQGFQLIKKNKISWARCLFYVWEKIAK